MLCDGQLEAQHFVTRLAPWMGGSEAHCVVGTAELCNSWTYGNTFISVDYTWLGRDFHKHFNIIKPESCLNLEMAFSKEYIMFCQILSLILFLKASKNPTC